MVKGEPLRILLVEDNEDHAELVKRSFEEHQVANKIIHVSDGQEALDYLFHEDRFADRTLSPRPNLILLDLWLPKVDGLEVLKKIKETPHLRRIPIVVLTTSTIEKDVAAAYEYHANSYVVKPLDFAGFTKMMSDLGFYWLGWNIDPWGASDFEDDLPPHETGSQPKK